MSNSNNDDVVNYYYLFIALFFICLAVALWFAHIQRRKKKLQTANSRHNALARDVNGLSIPRRWIHGSWRPVDDRQQEEGLDERGEAPPPYIISGQQSSQYSGLGATAGPRYDGQPGIAVPMQTFQGHHRYGSKPPDYSETVTRSEVSSQDGQGRSRDGSSS